MQKHILNGGGVNKQNCRIKDEENSRKNYEKPIGQVVSVSIRYRQVIPEFFWPELNHINLMLIGDRYHMI